ncbi:MAG: N-acetylmuramoyl-L-alanine amidase [Bacteroides oleiciplenus]|nr:MAG: N-acetylmuramoyl-L-alanine amidase [Bacteroides oleiciplenus]
MHRHSNKMRRHRYYILYTFICLWLLSSPLCISNSWAKDFVVVIDAGHGGHDPGAVGKISKEKNINLNVALKLGNMIKKNCDDVKVIFTRTKDVFIPLNRRAEIANNAKADLFISIHTNALANNRTAKGASTWTLGLAKSDANLAVAQRENSVILYESDYKTRYAGFNPNSAESYIIFEFMQDKYMEQSVHLASLIQKQFRHTCKRVDRGVHQAGFLVLKASAMPSILVELGFISTPEEERYLNSEEGTGTLAKGIYRAFLIYKKEHEIRLTGVSRTIIPDDEEMSENELAAQQPKEEKPDSAPDQTELVAQAKPQQRPITVESATNSGEITFKIQILTSSSPLTKNDKRLKGLKDVDYYKEKGLYKYTYGASTDYNKVLRSKRAITDKFKDAFIIAFRDGEKMNINAAIAEFKKKRNK